jgi:ribonuclease HI
MELIIYIDGGSRGNPGPAAAGVVINAKSDGKPVHEAGYYIGNATNNVAEYQGLIRSLQDAKKLGGEHVHIFSDSQLMVRQITGQYRVKSPDLQPLHEQAQMLLLEFSQWEIQHVLREKNTRADELVNIALGKRADIVIDAAGNQHCEADILERDVVDDTPHWTARFAIRPSFDCPAMCDANKEYRFGPTTPQGLCIYAADVILDEGPLTWSDPKQREGETWCPRCNAQIILTRVD